MELFTISIRKNAMKKNCTTEMIMRFANGCDSFRYARIFIVDNKMNHSPVLFSRDFAIFMMIVHAASLILGPVVQQSGQQHDDDERCHAIITNSLRPI